MIGAMLRRILTSIGLLLASVITAQAAGTLDAAGRIENTRTGRSCSGVLVAPGLVATAAHCVPEVVRRKGADAGFVFRAAPPAAAVPVKQGVVHPLYDQGAHRADWKFRFDLGLLILSDPGYGTVYGSLPVGDEAVPGETLFLVSWRMEDGDQPRHRACPVLEVGLEGLVTLGCDVKGGESGAPLFRRADSGALELVAIISSRGRLLDQPIAQASNLRIRLQPLLDAAKDMPNP